MKAFKMAAANILKGLLLLISLCVVAKPSDAFDYGLVEETCQEVNLSNWSDIRSLFLKDEAFLEFMKINNESLFQFVEALQVDNPFTAHIAGESIFSSPEIKTFELSSSLAVAVEVKRNENRSSHANFDEWTSYIKSMPDLFAEDDEFKNYQDYIIGKQIEAELERMLTLSQAARVDYLNSVSNNHYLGHIKSNLISDVYKLCSYRYIPNFNNEFELSFPDDFTFIFETINADNQRLEDQIIGAQLSGTGTINQSKTCIEPGKILTECHVLPLQVGSNLLLILVDQLTLKQRYELSKAKQVTFRNCIISEIGNPRSIGGAQITSYVGSLTEELRGAAVDSVSNSKENSDTIQQGIEQGLTTTLLGFTEIILKPETRLEVLDTITCELSFADLALK